MSGNKFKSFFTGINRTSENLISSVVSKVNSVASSDGDSIGTDSKDRSGSLNSSHLDSESSRAEGFLCPQCLAAFPNGDLLTEHFSSEHSHLLFDQQSANDCHYCKMRFITETELSQHIARYHSSGIDKQSIDTQLTDGSDGPVIPVEQIDALNELNKRMVETIEAENRSQKIKIEELEQRLHELITENSQLQACRNELEMKVIQVQLEGENVSKDFCHQLELKNETIQNLREKLDCQVIQQNTEQSIAQMLEKVQTRINDLDTETEREIVSKEYAATLSANMDNLKSLWSEDINKLTEVTKEKDVQIQKLETKITATERQVESLASENQTQKAKIVELDETLQKTVEKNSKQESQNRELQSAKQALEEKFSETKITTEKELASLRVECQNLTEQLKSTTDVKQKLSKDYGELQCAHEEYRKKSSDEAFLLQAKFDSNAALVEEYKTANQQLEAKLNSTDIILQNNCSQLSALHATYDEHLKASKATREKFNLKFAKLVSGFENADRLYVQIKMKFDTSKKELEIIKQSIQSGLDLKDFENKIKLELNRFKENVDKNVGEKIQQLSNSKQELEKRVENLTSSLEAKQRNFEELEAKQSKSSEQISKLTEQLQKSIADNAIQIKQLVNEKKSIMAEIEKERARFENAQQIHDKTLGEKLKLEIELSTFMEEKRALLERCVASEESLDKAKDEISDLSRNLDENIKTVHEFALQNQTLQIQFEQLQEKLKRTWTDDRSVTNCMNRRCAKQFTAVVRKHHCRYCGAIFCSECSSKTAQVTGHKDKVRVCDACHAELNQ